MLKVLAAYAAGVLCLAGCAGTIALPIHPSSGPPSANYPAADLRARVTLLYGEHTYVLGKLAIAAVWGHKDEFASYAELLAINADDLTAALSKAAGESRGTSFHQARVLGDSFYVDYIVAATTQQKDLSGAAMQNLNSKYVPQMAQTLSSTLNISTGTANKLLGDEVSSTQKFIDDAAAPAFYPDLRDAYSKAIAMGGSVAESIAWKFPDKYPGDVTASAAKLRAQLDALLQEHSLLMTLVTTPLDVNTANSANQTLVDSKDALAKVIGSAYGANEADQARMTWTDVDGGLAGYAFAADDQTKQNAIDNLNHAVTPELASFFSGLHVQVDASGQIRAAMQVIDDQRARTYDNVASDDRVAAALMISAGDALLGANQE